MDRTDKKQPKVWMIKCDSLLCIKKVHQEKAVKLCPFC